VFEVMTLEAVNDEAVTDEAGGGGGGRGGSAVTVVTPAEPFCIDAGRAAETRGRESFPADMSRTLLDSAMCLFTPSGNDSISQLLTELNFRFHLSKVEVAK
jgi:hypothetical protein